MAERTHPHAEATYRVIPFDDGTYGVEVSIPDSYPDDGQQVCYRGRRRSVDRPTSAAGCSPKFSQAAGSRSSTGPELPGTII
jgi:hypothetical protein